MREEMKLCNYCDMEVGGKGAGDEYWDYCYACDMYVEGDTQEGEDERDL